MGKVTLIHLGPTHGHPSFKSQCNSATRCVRLYWNDSMRHVAAFVFSETRFTRPVSRRIQPLSNENSTQRIVHAVCQNHQICQHPHTLPPLLVRTMQYCFLLPTDNNFKAWTPPSITLPVKTTNKLVYSIGVRWILRDARKCVLLKISNVNKYW